MNDYSIHHSVLTVHTLLSLKQHGVKVDSPCLEFFEKLL